MPEAEASLGHQATVSTFNGHLIALEDGMVGTSTSGPYSHHLELQEMVGVGINSYVLNDDTSWFIFYRITHTIK